MNRSPGNRRRCVATAKQTPMKKYVVKLSEEERVRLNTLIQTDKHRARQTMPGNVSDSGH